MKQSDRENLEKINKLDTGIYLTIGDILQYLDGLEKSLQSVEANFRMVQQDISNHILEILKHLPEKKE